MDTFIVKSLAIIGGTLFFMFLGWIFDEPFFSTHPNPVIWIFYVLGVIGIIWGKEKKKEDTEVIE